MLRYIVTLTVLIVWSVSALAQIPQFVPVPHEWIDGINAFGRPITSQPALSDLSDTTDWTSYTPSLSCGVGTLTSATSSAKYTAIGSTVIVIGTITITTNGTCATDIMASLPFAASLVSVGAGRENAVSGKMLQIYSAAGFALSNIVNYDNTYPGADGAVIYFTLTYEK